MRCSGQDEVVVGVPVAGRGQAETHHLVGYFINTMPIRGQLAQDSSLADLARSAARCTAQAVEHSLLPLQHIVSAVGAQRVPGANPLFQALLQYMPDDEHVGDLSFEGAGRVSLSESSAGSAQAKMDLAFYIDCSGRVHVEYMAELYDAAAVQRVGAAFLRLLGAAAETPQALAAGVPLLTAEDASLLGGLVASNMRPEYLEGPLTVQRFEDAVATHAQRVALQFEGQEMAYAEVGACARGCWHVWTVLICLHGSKLALHHHRSLPFCLVAPSSCLLAVMLCLRA